MEVTLSKSCLPLKMTSVEMHCFSCFVNEERLQPDKMMQISRVLGEDSGKINEAYLQYQNKGITSKHFRNVFIHEICGKYAVQDIVKTLLLSNILHPIGSKLFWYFYDSKPGRRTVNVPRLRNHRRRDTTSYFVFLKNAIHARNFSNPYEHVKGIAHRYLVKLQGHRLKDRDRQKFSDMYVALKAIEYDACSNVNETASEDEERFKEMERVLDQTTCPSLSRVLLFGRKADAASSARRFEEGEKMLTEAYVFADLSHSCLEIVDMIYKGVVFKLSHFEQDTTEELQQEIIFDAHRALTLLSEEHEDDQKFWKILLIIRMVFALLGIGKQCRIIPNYRPNFNCVKQANDILEMIDASLLDHRKQMFYQVAKARYCQFCDRMMWCKHFLTEAMRLAISGRYASRQYIEEYGRMIGVDLAYLYDLEMEVNNEPVLQNPMNEETGVRVYLNTLPPEVQNNPLTHIFPNSLEISEEETEDENTNEEVNSSIESNRLVQDISHQNTTNTSLEESLNSSIGLRSVSPLTRSSFEQDMSR